MIGQKFGRLTVTESAGYMGHSPAFICRCECGNTCSVRKYHLLNGKQRSCGCLRSEERATKNIIHGHSVVGKVSPEFTAWCKMRRRCENPSDPAYHYYGARGIVVDPAWQEFSNFLAHIGPRPGKKYSLDRIDVDGNYEPGNVRWATWHQQRMNQRRTSPERRHL